MGLPKLEDLDVEDKKVILRMDLDVDVDKSDEGLFRLEKELPTPKYLTEKAKRVFILGHKGRPEHDKRGELLIENNERLTLEPLVSYFSKKLSTPVSFVPYHYLSRLTDATYKNSDTKLILVENIRMWSQEEDNQEQFAKYLASSADCYVNESFAVSHRSHVSIVGIPKHIKGAFGFRFAEEVSNLEKVTKDPKRPVVILISGLKKDKLDYIESFKKFADKILVAGRLPEFLGDNTQSVRLNVEEKVVVANLAQDKEDITLNSIERFEAEIAKAGTIVVSGPIGKFEEDGHMQGTKRIFEAVAGNKNAFKVAGGGETQKAISVLGLTDKFDWISVGGGAMLEFLAKGTLPGIDAIKV